MDKLISTINVVYNPNSSHQDRSSAYQALEELKESSTSFLYGFELAADSQPLNVRHFGLQCVENGIKYKWNDLNSEQRFQIKNWVFEFVKCKLKSIEEETGLIKEAIGRCVVEMVKREWPQQWPNFYEECVEICAIGEVQTQVVICILQRLVEDVVTLQTVECMSRRRDLNNALVLCMPQILTMCITTLQKSSGLLCKTVLQLLAEVLDWIPTKVLQPQASAIVCEICRFLCITNDEHDLKLQAAVCLWQLASRKASKQEELKPVLCLFEENVMCCILGAAQAASGSVSEEHYSFLKTICGVLVGLGTHLCSVWGPKGLLQSAPPQFSIFFQAIVAFFNHPALKLRNEASQLLVLFFQHEFISEHEIVKSAMPQIMQIIPQYFQRFWVGFPSKKDHPSCEFALLEYGDDEEFILDISWSRQRLGELLRLMMKSDCQLAFDMCTIWIMQTAIPNFQNVPQVEWEAWMKVIRIVFESLTKYPKFNDKAIQERGISVLDSVCERMHGNNEWETVDHALSLLSSAFPFLRTFPDRLDRVLNIIFEFCSSVVEPMNSASKTVKLHALADLLKLCTEYSDLVVAKSNEIFSMAEQIIPRLSLMQQPQLFECLGSLSNHLESQESQNRFLEVALGPTVEFWTSQSLTTAVSSPECFLHFIGLKDKPPVTEEQCLALPFYENRLKLRAYSQMLYGLLGQVKSTSNGNPLFLFIKSSIPNIFLLARSLNGIYSTNCLKLIHKDYGLQAIDITECEKHTIKSAFESMYLASAAGQYNKKTPQDHSRAFLSELPETVQQVIGRLVNCDHTSFFSMPQASQLLLHGSLGFVNDSLDLRLRFILRYTWKPIFASVHNCTDLNILNVLLPAIICLLECMSTRLQNRWDAIEQWTNGLAADAEPTAQETLMEDTSIVLTREVMLTVKELLITTESNNSTTEKMSSLGAFVLDNEICRCHLLMLVFKALGWRDSVSARKATNIAIPLINQLVASNLLDEGSANHLFYLVLSSLSVHGSDDNLSGSLINMAAITYEKLRKPFPNLRQILLQIPDCVVDNLDSFDSKLTNQNAQNPMPDKLKKDMMKKIVKGIIGKNVGEKYKRQVHMRILPPLLKPNRIKVSPVEEPDLQNIFGSA